MRTATLVAGCSLAARWLPFARHLVWCPAFPACLPLFALFLA